MSEGGAMFCDDRDRSYGCLFCRTGREETTANELKRLFPEIEIIVPVKSRYWRHGGVAREEHVVLFPGYIFFQVDNAFDVFVFAKCNNVYSLLKAPSGDWKIRNEDRKIVEKLFASKGVIGFSKAYFELKNKEKGIEILKLLNPIYHSDTKEKADKYMVEPYVVAADIYSNPEHPGRGGWTWYTGSSAWMYKIIEDYLK